MGSNDLLIAVLILVPNALMHPYHEQYQAEFPFVKIQNAAGNGNFGKCQVPTYSNPVSFSDLHSRLVWPKYHAY